MAGEAPGPPPAAARKGRGAVSAIAHRFERLAREPDGDARDHARRERADEGDDPDALPALATTVTPERIRSLITRNESPDLGFDRAINPYRGCEHGCSYCYARPTHGYLGLSPGLDFETRLVAKLDAAEVLERELARPGYRPAPVMLGSATDAYQPIERSLRLTRAVIERLVAAGHPFLITTKSALVERDLDLLAPAAARRLVGVCLSITTLDPALARALEPRAAAPARRLRTVAALAGAGVPVHVNFSPVIPFVNEPELERVVAAAAAAGAGAAHYTVIRLPWEVAPLFREWLEAHLPGQAARVMARIREMRGGRDYDPDFATRMKGEGTWAELIGSRFRLACRRAGLPVPAPPIDLAVDGFRAPAPRPAGGPGPQLDLFGAP